MKTKIILLLAIMAMMGLNVDAVTQFNISVERSAGWCGTEAPYWGDGSADVIGHTPDFTNCRYFYRFNVSQILYPTTAWISTKTRDANTLFPTPVYCGYVSIQNWTKPSAFPPLEAVPGTLPSCGLVNVSGTFTLFNVSVSTLIGYMHDIQIFTVRWSPPLWQNASDTNKLTTYNAQGTAPIPTLHIIAQSIDEGANITVTGTVTSTNSTPIDGATVNFQSPFDTYETTTNSTGNYTLTNIAAYSNYTLIATKFAFIPNSQDDINLSVTTHVGNIQLTPGNETPPTIDGIFPNDDTIATSDFNILLNVSDLQGDNITVNITSPLCTIYNEIVESGSALEIPWSCFNITPGSSYNYTVILTDGTNSTAPVTYNFTSPTVDCSMNTQSLEICCNITAVPDEVTSVYRITDVFTSNCGTQSLSSTDNVCWHSEDGLTYNKEYELKAAYGAEYCNDAANQLSDIFNFTTYECYENATPTGCPEGYDCSGVLCVSNITNESTSGNTTLTFWDWTDVSSGEMELLIAYYEHNGVPITGASCNYSSDGIVPTTNTLFQAMLDVYARNVQIKDNTQGPSSYIVTCSRNGYPTLQAQNNFTIHNGTSVFTTATWILSPSLVENGGSALFTVAYETSGDVAIIGGSCTLQVGLSSYTMIESPQEGHYYYSFTASSVGSYSYSANCTKTNYQDAVSSTRTLNVYERDEEPEDPQPDHCTDGVENYDESYIDCGGSCDPCGIGDPCEGIDDNCYSGWCGTTGICLSPSCSDNIMNGDESGIDCGGPCPDCMCFENWDCSPDGSESCISNSCTDDNCTVSADCSSILWYDLDLGYFTADRECANSKCRFLSQNETTGDIVIDIFPVFYLVWNDSGRDVYVSSCEEGTNAFSVKTNLPTRNWYFLSNPTFYSPYATPTGQNFLFGDNELLTLTTDDIPEMCLMQSSYDRLYSLITFYATDGTNERYRSIYALTFKKAFTGNASYLDTNQINISLSRNATCSYRQSETDNWTLINSVESSLVFFNQSASQSWFFQCNNTYGEGIPLIYRGGNRIALDLLVFVIAAMFNGLYTGLFGTPYVWQTWHILIIAILALFTFPTLLIILFYMKRKEKEQRLGKF